MTCVCDVMHLQVLSSSVAKAMEIMGDTSLSETIRFVKVFDRFSDCLNVTSLSGGRKALKADLYPYRTPNDSRFQVSYSIHCIHGCVHTFIIL